MSKANGRLIKMAPQIKRKCLLFFNSLLLVMSCHPLDQAPSIEGSWEYSNANGKTVLIFQNDSLTQYYTRRDTSYTVQCAYKLYKDTLLLTYADKANEMHYLKWQNKNKFILSPHRPNEKFIPSIDLIEFRKVKQ